MVLGEVPGMGFVPPLDLAGVGTELADDDLEQRRLADTVGSHDGDAVAAPHRQIDTVQHFVVAERLLHPLDGQSVAATGAPLLESEGRITTRALR